MAEAIEIAKKLMDIVPPAMHWIREEMRSESSNSEDELSVPQFRIMASIYRGRNVASEIAKHHGISQAAMSKMIDSLVARKFVEREANENDRRHFHLNLTVEGRSFFQKTKSFAQSNLEKQITCLNKNERESLSDGLLVLEKLFQSARNKN